jgi:hypothetical protein
MSTARNFLSATVLVGMTVCSLFVTGCETTKAVGDLPAETVTPSAVDQASIQAMGPPPGYVKPEIYWVRERIILTSASEPPAPATQKSVEKKGKKNKKTGKRVTG